jgi:hypothetical protein
MDDYGFSMHTPFLNFIDLKHEQKTDRLYPFNCFNMLC